MLVILTENQLLQPAKVCQSCPMASQSGLPRWHNGQLRCGRLVAKPLGQAPAQYECAMGFRVAELSDSAT
ncbi:MAG: hypothetical protein HLUCCA11_15955 [Phormidesmis priestleyi Ana]|uniref:Uncharacterized protein n=1 Tax=Phormidesmis priestleyi Ana TaxID=1666911 RepID=A0A0N8KML6_9CYAN|nr:MAG: hypothetical protein HLUCCA11_15955 [Phormidesmis priestleyi Ana]